MENLECTTTAACRQYCEALRLQGVSIELGEAGCTAPELFEINADSVTFNPGVEVEKPALVSMLGESLCDALIRDQRDKEAYKEAAKLEGLYHDQFGARLNLWQAMLQATREKRQFTDVELDFYEKQMAYVEESVAEVAEQTSEEAVLRAQAMFDHYTIEKHGLLFDEQVTGMVNQLVGNLMEGKSSLIVGDKGIAKTQAARFVARLWDGEDKEPVIISGHGDQMSHEFIGKDVLDKNAQGSSFRKGKLIQAMVEGRPVLLDEVDLSDQPIMMRLQDFLLLRPGDKVNLQEDGDEEIIIQPGFAAFATANEASKRYQHRVKLDPAFRDRFSVVRAEYPDIDKKPITEIPHSLMRLALASAVDERGKLSDHTPALELERMARLAHATQALYSLPANDTRIPQGLRSGQATSEFLQSTEEPAMSDCITPRTLVETVRRCSLGNKPGMDLEGETKKLIDTLDQAGSTTNKKYANMAYDLLTKDN